MSQSAASTIPPATLVEAVARQAETRPRQPCLIDPATGVRISYVQLIRDILELAGQLRAGGVGSGDRVALLLPNGPEYVVAYLAAMAAGGIAVPIHPASKPAEVQSILALSGARALLADPVGVPLPDVADRLELTGPNTRLACLLLPPGVPGTEDPAVQPGDALMMFTSGTTGQPKGVVIQHRNLLASAHAISTHFGLGEEDVSLCVLPLTHIHGQIASLVSTLCSGGTVVLPRGFNAFGFWGLVQRHRVTWVTAVPTVYTLLLHKAEPRQTPRHCLRFARSASAPLPLAVLNRFEELYGCPILEAYGLTEATHQAAANPLPPGQRKWSSVGRPTGTEIAAVGESGEVLPAGEEGELVLRGASVTRGYFRNEQATAEAFAGPWFRTGDLGQVDADGYVFITGRKKEQINRGGQKISPREVDEVLYRHPAVAEAAAVGAPHPVYGEEVHAYVVLHPGRQASAREIVDHCSAALADYKCPAAVHFVSELPKSAAGKIQRLKLPRPPAPAVRGAG